MARRDPLDGATLDSALAGTHWRHERGALIRRFEFATFRDAVRFVDGVADVAETLNHHPDIDIRWRTVTLAAWTHTVGAVTQMDLELVEQIDRLEGVPA